MQTDTKIKSNNEGESEWFSGYMGNETCKNCGCEISDWNSIDWNSKWNFCPNCGYRMMNIDNFTCKN